MILHALTESNSNQTLLLKLLQREHDAGWIKFWYSALPSSLYGSARTVLGVWKKPAALVLDADSTNPRAADRCRLDAEEVIGEAAGMAPLRVLVAVRRHWRRCCSAGPTRLRGRTARYPQDCWN